MERKSKEGIILQKGESLHVSGKYMFRWTDKMGRRRAIYADNIIDLRYMEHQLYLTRELETKIDPTTLKINELFYLWKSHKYGIQKSTLTNYVYAYETYIQEGFGRNKVISIRKSDVRQLYADILYHRDIKKSTLGIIHNVLHQVFQYGYEEGIIFANPASGAYEDFRYIRKIDDGRKVALTCEEEKCFLDYINQKKWKNLYPIFVVLAGTGMRISEVSALQWKDINFEKEEIFVNKALVYEKQGDKVKLSFHPTKTEAGDRIIPMLREVKEALVEERRMQIWRGQKNCCCVEGYNDFVFLSREGTPRTQNQINASIHRICTEYNEIMFERGESNKMIPYFTCHTLRHSFATRMCESGMNIKMIQYIMGHSDIDTTMNIYVAVTNQMQKNSKEALQEHFDRMIFTK